MLHTYKPTNVFICDNTWNNQGKNVVTVKFEIPCTADKWVLEPDGRWVMQGTLSLSDILTTNTYEIKEEFRGWELNDRMANQLYLNMMFASVSLVLPGLNVPLKQTHVTMSNMDQFSFRIINPHYITYGVDCEFASPDGMFAASNVIALGRPDMSRTYEKNIIVDTGKTDMRYLDECVLIITIDFALSPFRPALDEATVHDNPYAIFGITTDTNTGKPRIPSYGQMLYSAKKSTLEETDGGESDRYQLFPVDYTRDADFKDN